MAEMILVRATIALPGLPVGKVVPVNPDNEYIQMCLRGADGQPYLIRVEPDSPPPVEMNTGPIDLPFYPAEDPEDEGAEPEDS